MKKIEPRWRIEVPDFPVSPRGDDVEAGFKQPVGWPMGSIHMRVIAETDIHCNMHFGVRGHVRALKAATCRRTPKFPS
ncbi:MAG: hypothetical protein DMF26_18810 [Verrucomicrobia bacterium]|nr:MAG: hypothetical protein DMF26_18810 [Verrucomicrobiota bacterium]